MGVYHSIPEPALGTGPVDERYRETPWGFEPISVQDSPMRKIDFKAYHDAMMRAAADIEKCR